MFKSLAISKKLGLAFGLVMLAAGITMGLVFVESVQVSRLAQINEVSDAEQALAAEVENAMLSAVANIRGDRVSMDARDIGAFEREAKRFDEAVARLTPLLRTPEEKAMMAATVASFRAWQEKRVAPALAGLSQAEAEQAHALAASGEAGEELRKMQAGAEALRVAKHEEVERNLEAIDRAAHEEEVAVVVGGVVIALVSLLLWGALRQLLVRPLILITAVMKRLAGGDNRVEVPDADRGDEVGDMARAVLVFRDAALAKEEADRAKAVADAEQQQVVDTLSAGLGRLSDGDLTVRIDSFPAGYARIRQNFNDAMAKLRDLIGTVRSSVETIRNGSAEIADASEQLSQQTQSNAASLEETNAAVTQIDRRVRSAAETAGATATRADAAIQIVDSGRGVTDEAVQAMGRVAESAKGIDSVIEGLDKIAFQTRVLAMNAAVEAGRAGEAGRGFAVVADLVSALAMRSEEEAKRARDQLTATQADIGMAVEAVQRVDGALAAISEGVGSVHGLVGGIATDNAAQANAVSEISNAIGSMDRSVQQNAAKVEEASAAARMLSNEANELATLAAQFRTEPSAGARTFAPAAGGATVH